MNQINILNQLKNLAKEGQNFGLSTNTVIKKIENTLTAIQQGIIKIAFVGPVSVGKTSIIAGLLEKVESSMDIEIIESTDDILVYVADFLGNKIQVIDTPGLFGEKEKEYDGKILRYSELTTKYLSEANIIIFVCNARNPYQDSHAQTINWIMRHLDKLPVSIFVINRMDEVCDITDDEDFNTVSHIKTDVLIKRLQETIHLTPEEGEKLKIFNTSADPDRRGLNFWLKHTEYPRISRLSNLKSEILSLTASDLHPAFLDAGAVSVIKDSMECLITTINNAIEPIQDKLKENTENSLYLAHDIENLRKKLIKLQNETIIQLDQYKLELISNIKSANLETFDEILDECIGISNQKVDFSVVLRDIKRISENFINESEKLIINGDLQFKRNFNDSTNYLTQLANEGLKTVKVTTISNKHVLAVRNLLFKNVKFQPYGAVKLANYVNKALPLIALGIDGLMEFYQYKKNLKRIKELEKSKSEIIDIIGDIFRQINELIGSKKFGENNAVLREMVDTLNSQKEELIKLKDNIDRLIDYKNRITLTLSSDIEDVKYEEL